MTLTLDLQKQTSFKLTAYFLIKCTLYMQYEPDWTKRKYALDKDRSCNSAMTLSFYLETWLKDTAYPLLKSSAYVQYEQNSAKRRVYMLFKKRFSIDLI